VSPSQIKFMQTDELKKKIQLINLPEVNSSLSGIVLEKKNKALYIDLSRMELEWCEDQIT